MKRDTLIARRFASGLFPILLIMTVGVVARLIYSLDELPYIYDGDERFFAQRSLYIATTGDLNPKWFGHPGTLYIYAIAAADYLYMQLSMLTALVDTPSGFLQRFSVNPADFTLIARLVAVAFSAAGFVAFWLMTRELLSRPFALLSLGLLAVYPIHVALSATARTDVPQTTLILLAILFSIRIFRHGRTGDFLISGAAVGFAVAIKYPSLIVAASVPFAGLLFRLANPDAMSWRRLAGRLALSGLALLGAAFAGSPYMFVEPDLVVKAVALEARPYHLSATSRGFFPAMGFYLSGPIMGIGIVGFVAGLIGAATLAGERKGWLILLPFGFYLLLICSLNLQWQRWATPLLPMFALLAGAGAESLFRLTSSRLSVGRKGALATVGAIAIAASPTIATAMLIRDALSPNAASRAAAWMAQNAPAGATVFVELYASQLPNGRYRLVNVANGRLVEVESKARYVVPVGDAGGLSEIDKLLVRADFVILGNALERYRMEAGRYGPQLQRYEQLLSRCEVRASFRMTATGQVTDSVAHICTPRKPEPAG